MMSQDPVVGGESVAASVEVRTPRRYDASYKLRILKELDDASELGEAGRILRREGLHSSLIVRWRRQRAEGALAGVQGGKPGRKASKVSAEVKRLQRENERLLERLAVIEELVEAQGKVSALLQRMSRESAGKK